MTSTCNLYVHCGFIYCFSLAFYLYVIHTVYIHIIEWRFHVGTFHMDIRFNTCFHVFYGNIYLCCKPFPRLYYMLYIKRFQPFLQFKIVIDFQRETNRTFQICVENFRFGFKFILTEGISEKNNNTMQERKRYMSKAKFFR